MDVDTDDVIEIGGTWLSPDHTAALQLSRERLARSLLNMDRETTAPG